jgi:membrane-bound lytic murein transglycosylase F
LIRKIIFSLIILAGIAVFLTCKKSSSARVSSQSYPDLDAIRKRGRLIAVTDISSTDYFIYSGEPMRSNHELIKSLNITRVSKYDDLIREFSSNINWDWRLLASLICQESQFRPTVVSNSGAYGLMQIMPVTARNFGIDITSSPKSNMKAGILYINWLYSIFNSRIADENERLSFVLASYNAGPGHVLDAMRLAEKNGKDPQKWTGNVAVWLLKKSEPEYYNDSVVKSGYFRGTESVKFVSEVLNRYEHYKNFIPQEIDHPF